MDQNRIKKLLSTEYRDFSDKIIVESPFAETNRDGHGIKEVTLALTPTKLIIASDVFRNDNEFCCYRGIDPSIESFELICIYPLEFIHLSIFRRRKRKTLKARLINGRVTYYELGGIYNKKKCWSVWCSQIEFLNSQRENGSSLSETTAASSSSSTTLYFLSSDIDIKKFDENNGNPRVCQLWTKYGGGGDGSNPFWPRKDIYLGPSYNELGNGLYAPIPIRFANTSFDDLQIKYELRPVLLNYHNEKSHHSWPTGKTSNYQKKNEKNCNTGLCDVLYMNDIHKNPRNSFSITSNTLSNQSAHLEYQNHENCTKKFVKKSEISLEQSDHVLAPKISRFGFGIRENCSSGLYLQPHEGDPDHLVKIKPAYKLMDPYQLIESGVSIWENSLSIKSSSNSKIGLKSFRRYGLATFPHFLFGLGPWAVQPGDKISIQTKRSTSLVSIRRQPIDEEMRLPVSKRQLSTSVSMSSLEPALSSAATTTRGRIVIFWTTDYWYRPRAAAVVYQELRNHLNRLRDFHLEKQKSKKSFFTIKNRLSGDFSTEGIKMCTKSSYILNKIFSNRDFRRKRRDINKSEEERTINQLKRLLKMNMKITVWDLDSTTIAKQLTLIDRDLFLRIPNSEIEIIIYQKSSRNSPNFGAWVAFSHRVSCLTCTEILAIKKLDMRTRMLARFINAANKCFSMGNFNSSRSIIAGLQSPPIYRLKATWNYLKIHHSTRYETFTKLCKIFKNCRTKIFIRAWEKAENRPPLLPYIGHFLSKILRFDNQEIIIKETPRKWMKKNYDCGCTYLYQVSQDEIIKKKTQLTCHTICSSEKKCEPNFLRKILSTTVGKIINKKSLSSNEIKYDIFWAAKRLIMARKYFDRWQTCLLTTRIIKEYEEKKRNIDWKKKTVADMNTWLRDFQRIARDYDFPGHSIAWEFLLKARYREDRENFYISLKLEPPLS